MLPPEGSVKDGRTIVYLERITPGGGSQDEGRGTHAPAKAKESGGSADEAAAPGKATFKAGEKKTAAKPEAPGKLKSSPAAVKKTIRARPTMKPLLPSSRLAASAMQAASMIAAAESGAPFCEDCAEAHRLLEEASRIA